MEWLSQQGEGSDRDPISLAGKAAGQLDLGRQGRAQGVAQRLGARAVGNETHGSDICYLKSEPREQLRGKIRRLGRGGNS